MTNTTISTVYLSTYTLTAFPPYKSNGYIHTDVPVHFYGLNPSNKN